MQKEEFTDDVLELAYGAEAPEIKELSALLMCIAGNVRMHGTIPRDRAQHRRGREPALASAAVWAQASLAAAGGSQRFWPHATGNDASGGRRSGF